jgi:glutathione synthase/RimK-type ligase-like ATP-grasp enzyme
MTTAKVSDHFDLAVAWDWEFDRAFVAQLEHATHALGCSFYSISHHNVHETLKRLQKDSLSFGSFLDRASDADENFLPLMRHVRKSAIHFFNHPDVVHRAIDKATMHLEVINRGIHSPYTIIISPFNKKSEVDLTLTELARLGRPFIIKPANTTGGGIGVITGAETLKDVIESRQHHKNDKYLLQEKIAPAQIHGRRAWFRVFFVCNAVIPCWWDDESHLYMPVTRAESTECELAPLHEITRTIADVCRLEFFSTEIALTGNGTFVVVDYVNDICDMRLQSVHPDGVPDAVVHAICVRLTRSVRLLHRQAPLHSV